MRFWVLIILMIAAGCGGNLSDEQRKKLKERMKEDEIKYVPEGEVLAAAFEYGRGIYSVLEKRDINNQSVIDSLEQEFNVKITTIQSGDSALLQIERQLIEAFISGAGQDTDDVQKIGADSLLYTKPIVRERPDGSFEFVRALSIHMPVKAVILSIDEE